ncbi:MAG TPA: competence/damage-inducible protein A [Candidatus Coprocola pullicola]|nr:competence/damage-inducible protein A [Candidatus Coprocola pullicola]
MQAEIIAVGTEILLGDILNTNAQYLALELAELGIDVHYQTVVGDNPKRLENTLFHAFSRADLIITTGGLGPTEDDLTKETGAKYFQEELVLDERAFKRIQKYFQKTGREMTQNNKKQAFVPKNSTVLYNDNGTAPGIIIEKNQKIMIMLPGPPKETVPMFENQVKPYLQKRQEYTFVSRILRIAGVGESAMETKVKDLIDAQTNPTIAPYAKDAESILRITAKAKTKQEAQSMIAPVAEEIYNRFGHDIYAEGETNMQTVTAQLLLKKAKTIATAESCTGGALASALVEYPGISSVFLDGTVTYSNEAKQKRLGVKQETLQKYGAVSAETAKEMAEGAANTAGTEIGLATTGIAGPNGAEENKPVGLVYIGLTIDGVTQVKQCHFVGNREKIRTRAVYTALDWLRRELLK